jgi:CheY-like chemotaxis protein
MRGEGPVAQAWVDADRRVLVVEDDRDVCDAICESLQEAGYQVASAENGAEALTWLRDCLALPGLILLDLMMPVMDGERFLEEFRKERRWSALPVVVLTADGRASNRASDLGAVCGLRKPIQLDDLLNAVSRHWAMD